MQVLKLFDFGLAHNMEPDGCGVMRNRCGTLGYMAPEVVAKGFTRTNERGILIGPEIDMWAFGVILYELSVAYSPTRVRGYKVGSPISFPPRDWNHHSPLLKDLIRKCLTVEPRLRPTAAEAMEHAWFKASE